MSPRKLKGRLEREATKKHPGKKRQRLREIGRRANRWQLPGKKK